MIYPLFLAVIAQVVVAANLPASASARPHPTATATELSQVVAADSIEVTNRHPHTMKIAMPGEKGETVLGEVGQGETKKLAIVIPKDAKSIVLRAFNPEDPAMEVSESVTIEAGKPLKWTVLVN